MGDFLDNIFQGLSEFLMTTFTGWGLSYDTSETFKNFINFIFIACISALSWYIAKMVIIRLVHVIVFKTANKYDDKLVEYKVVEPLSQIFPALYIYWLIQYTISDPYWVELIQHICYAWNILSVIIILYRALDAAYDIVNDIMAQRQRKINIKGYVQVIKIIIGIAGAISMFSVVIGESPAGLLGALGGMSAVMMLVFKDTLSGFVASIQLTSNNMVKMNDWITMNNRHVEGNVVEITLNTVKVRNFDNSIVTVPTASLMSESFINWSNMQEMEARRMKRTIMIDSDSVRIASPELLDKVKKIPFMTDYIEQRQKTAENKIDNFEIFEKMEISNLELFRKYIEFYIKANYQIFKKYQPTVMTDDKGNTREIYIIDNKQDFLELHGEKALKYIKELKDITYIKDLEGFLKEFKNNLVQDKKDKKTYYPTKTIRNTTYINDHSKSFQIKKRIIVKDGMFVENGHLMVRQMQQTPTGIPLEIYCFTKVTEWASFEKMQSAFFEHLFAIINEFGLKAFQFSKCELRENALE